MPEEKFEDKQKGESLNELDQEDSKTPPDSAEIPNITGVPPRKKGPVPEQKEEVSQESENVGNLDGHLDNNEEKAPKKRSAIRTFEGDVAEALKGGESLSSMALKEQERRLRTGEDKSEKKKSHISKKSVTVLGLVLLFISLGAGAIYFALSKGGNESPGDKDSIFKNPIIFSDSRSVIDTTNLSKNDLIDSLSRERESYSGTVGSIENVYLTTGMDVEQRLLTGPELLTSLETGADQSLIRSIGDDFMYGIHSFDGNDSFFIFKINNFEVVFARMLDWEEFIFEDLGKIFYQNPNEEFVFNVEGEVGLGERPSFKDLVIKSRDARALRDLEGKTALIYAFPDRSTLIITTNKDTLSEIFTRLTSSRF